MSYSKRYISKKNPNSDIFIRWEAGYKNVEVVHGTRVVCHIASPAQISRGFSYTDPELGKIELSFSERPITIKLKVNRTKYNPYVDKSSMKVDVGGLTAVFWSLSALALMGTLISLGVNEFQLSHPVVFLDFIINLLAIGIYTATAILLAKRKGWAYYVGTSFFLIMTGLYVLGSYAEGFNAFVWIFIFFRAVFITYIVSQFKNVRLMMEQENKEENTAATELLDI